MEKFEFNPVSGFEDGSAYPNPSNEQEVRAQLMRPLIQLQTYINNLVDTLNSSDGLKEIGTENGTLIDLLNDYVLKEDLNNDLSNKLDINLGDMNKGLVLYIDDEGNVKPINLGEIGGALAEDVVPKFQGVENAGKVLAVDQGGQVVPVTSSAGGSGAGGYYDIKVADKVMEINYVITNGD